MTATRWRTLCFVFGAICVWQFWRGGAPAEPPPPGRDGNAPPRALVVPGLAATRTTAEPAAEAPAETADGDLALYGFQLPSWVAWLAPHPGEDLRAYRDRLLPLAVAAVAPQRARVTRSRDSFAQLAHLEPQQRAVLDAAVDETATALQDRILTAVLGNELSPATFKPMTGVALARDLLDLVGRGNRRFLDALRDDQRAALAQHPFDFGDYLVFSTRWEDALKLL